MHLLWLSVPLCHACRCTGQTYASPGLSKQGLQALQSHSLDTVRAVTKELLQIGFLKKCEHCGSERCAQKPGPCKHNKVIFIHSPPFRFSG